VARRDHAISGGPSGTKEAGGLAVSPYEACTKKFLDRVGRPTASPGDPSTTALGSWYATVLPWRPQVALFVNEMTCCRC
jgi:hypothetical protein